MVLMIDNYDSFVYNLVQYIGELGAEIDVYRNDRISIPEIEKIDPESIVISPGPGRPEDAGISCEIVRHFAGRKPILGVCLGHQCIGHVFGGRVIRAANLMHGKTSEIYHEGGILYRGIPSPFTATRYHSLILEKETLPASLQIESRTGEDEIMGVKHKDFLLYGVQFHPESILTTGGKKMVSNFLSLAGQS